MPSDSETLSLEALSALLSTILQRHGCAPDVAACLGTAYARAERDGSVSHGIFRIEGLISTLASGWVDGAATPVVEDVAPGFLRVDAANGFAQPALAAARARFVERIRSQGIALLAIRNSHHFGALWLDMEPFAEEGLIALSMVNSMTCSVPAGAQKPVFGTNPIGVAAPITGAEAPLVLDLATTTMAHGDVQVARREGRQLPPDTGYDAAGNPTGDPEAILNGGALAPFGGHKGSAISMMVELMCAGISGGNFSWEFSWADHPGAQTPRTGQILIGIDPSHGGPIPFADRAGDLIAKLRAAGLAVYPGLRRRLLRNQRRESGIPIRPERLAELRALA
ncbi:Ldh family oxidoreductase [Thioclava sp. BHET1]|nr:Ldh family oxidoreductase [Thioclava sp. BHET1]